MSATSDESGRTAKPVTFEQLTALYRQISEQEHPPHQCIVHPQGGICFGCGQPWRLVAGRMEPVIFDRISARSPRRPMGRPLAGGPVLHRVGWFLGFLTVNPDLCPFWQRARPHICPFSRCNGRQMWTRWAFKRHIKHHTATSNAAIRGLGTREEIPQ